MPYPVSGGAVVSATFTPTQPGTYRWVASFSGDANNNPVSGACNDPNETVVVTAPVVLPPADPPPTTLPATGSAGVSTALQAGAGIMAMGVGLFTVGIRRRRPLKIEFTSPR